MRDHRHLKPGVVPVAAFATVTLALTHRRCRVRAGLRGPLGGWTEAAVNEQIPEPNACGLCNLPQRGHFQRWMDAAGWHGHTQPTDRQRLERMQARRAARTAAREPKPARPELEVTITADTSRFTEAITSARGAIDFVLWEAER